MMRGKLKYYGQKERLRVFASMRPAHDAREVFSVADGDLAAVVASMRPAHDAREVRQHGRQQQNKCDELQ